MDQARKKGYKSIALTDINKSFFETSIKNKNIYLGFHFLKGLEKELIEKIVEEREKRGSYLSLDDFIDRIPLSIESLDILIRIDAFRFLKETKRNLLWQAYIRLKHKQKPKQNLLFENSPKKIQIPSFHTEPLENVFDEIELLGFPLQIPFLLLKEKIENSYYSKDLKKHLNQTIILYGYLVNLKNTKTSRGELMMFGTFLDELGDWIDTVHFPNTSKKHPFRGNGIYKLEGRVVDDFGFLTLEVSRMKKMVYLEDARFHGN